MAHKVNIGRHTLDTLTLGMYSDPLCIFREYIQNSADSIDRAIEKKQLAKDKGEISINIDNAIKKITIEDNGLGVLGCDVESVLLSVGNSSKSGNRERGFRGIGRLGGIAYCDALIFHTKAAGESKYYVNKWDCTAIRQMLDPHSHQHHGKEMADVIEACTNIESHDSSPNIINDSYFKVELINVSNHELLDTAALKKYISEVAPVPFSFTTFPWGQKVDERLRKDVPSYNTYKILVNATEIFKPYKTTLNPDKNSEDRITDVVEFEILDGVGKVIAKGWRAEREKLNNSIVKTAGVDGIRVRTGNILIGDADLLDDCFTERRFNSWTVGEIHTIDPRLLPNSRRDNFEPNDMREAFYKSVKEVLGIPLSGVIRERSKSRSQEKPIAKAEQQILNIKGVSKKGFVGDAHKHDEVQKLKASQDDIRQLLKKRKLSEKTRKEAEIKVNNIDYLINDIEKSKENDITGSLSSKYTKKEIELIKQIFNLVYINYEKHTDPIKLLNHIVKKLLS